MKKLSICLSIFAATLAAVGGASAAPTITNGSFESPDFTSGTVLVGSYQSGGVGWTPSGTNVYLFDNASGLGVTPYGSQYLTLNPGSTDTQNITGFSLGGTYTLSGYFADMINGTSPTLTMTLAGLTSVSQTFTTAVAGPYGNSTIPFTHTLFTFTVVPTFSGLAGTVVPNADGSLTLTLRDGSTNGTIGIDNIAFVPEPSSILASFVGVGALGWVIRKRRS